MGKWERKTFFFLLQLLIGNQISRLSPWAVFGSTKVLEENCNGPDKTKYSILFGRFLPSGTAFTGHPSKPLHIAKNSGAHFGQSMWGVSQAKVLCLRNSNVVCTVRRNWVGIAWLTVGIQNILSLQS